MTEVVDKSAKKTSDAKTSEEPVMEKSGDNKSVTDRPDSTEKDATTTTQDGAAADTETTKAEVDSSIPASKRPRPPRPNANERNALVDDLKKKIEVLYDSIKKKKETLTSKTSASSEELTILKTEHAKNKQLQKVRKRLQGEFKVVLNQRDEIESQIKKLIDHCKSMRDDLKFTSIEEVDRRIEALEHKQGTQSMTLNEEKALLKQIKELNQSKRTVQQYAAKNKEIKALKEKKDAMKSDINAKHKLVREATEKTNAQWDHIQKLNEKYKKKGDEFPKLKASIQADYDQVKEHRATIDKAYKDYQKANQAWFEWNKAIRAEQEKEVAEQRRIAEEKYKAELAAFEAEEAKKKPWLEEIALCDTLIGYLGGDVEKKDNENEYRRGGTSTLGVVAGNDRSKDLNAQFAGMTTLTKDEEDYFAPVQKKKKKHKKKGKKGLLHSIDTLNSFEFLGLTAPSNQDGVAKAIADLRAKRAYFDTLPRAAKTKDKEKTKEPSTKKNGNNKTKETTNNGITEDIGLGFGSSTGESLFSSGATAIQPQGVWAGKKA